MSAPAAPAVRTGGPALAAEIGAASIRRWQGGSEPALWRVAAEDPQDGERFRQELSDALRPGRGTVVGGGERRDLLRPWPVLAALAAKLVESAAATDRQVVERFRVPVGNVLPSSAHREGVGAVPMLSSQLAAFALRGELAGLVEFDWRRDVSHWITADLGRFLLEAAQAAGERSGGPCVLCLEVPDDTGTAGIGAGGLARHLCGERVTIVSLAAGPDSPPPAEDERHLRLLTALSVFALPVALDTLLGLLPPRSRSGGETVVEELLSRGRIEAFGTGSTLAFPSAAAAERVHRSAAPAELRRLHREALEIEADDPFATSWHLVASGTGGARAFRRHLEAMERAWAVSDFDCALALAERALAERTYAGLGDESLDPDVVLGLLHHEAGRPKKAEDCLARARDRQAEGTAAAVTLDRLLGYNAVFGLGELDRGRALLTSARASLEERSRIYEVCGVDNSIAFTLARQGRQREARDLERQTLATLERAGRGESFLASILRLNLARLDRELGLPDRALDLLDRAMDDRGADVNPFMLLLFHCSRAEIFLAAGQQRSALAALHHAQELTRGLRLEHVSYPHLNALSRPLDGLEAGRELPPGERFALYLALNQAALLGSLGAAERAAAILAGLRRRHPELASALETQVEAVSPEPKPELEPELEPERPPVPFERVPAELRDLVAETARGGGAAAAAARELVGGRTVAVVARREIAPGVHSVDSLVLFDPRSAAAASRLRFEIGAERWSAAPSALALREAAPLFRGGLEPQPLLPQTATLERSGWDELPGVVPVRLQIQLLDPRLDAPLASLLAAFHRAGGPLLLAALPFRLRLRDLASTPLRAVGHFLISGLDHLWLGDRLLSKAHGPQAVENLLPSRPRLASGATLFADGDRVVVRVQEWSYRRHYRLRSNLEPFLRACSGERTLAELLDELPAGTAESSAGRERLGSFVRRMWHGGVLQLDDPFESGARHPVGRSAGRPATAMTG